MATIDLNCDMGEGMPFDELIFPYISSVNIACGYHAGSEEIMKRTVALALQYDIAIGAHPGFADKENFGRKEMHLTDENYYNLVVEQLTALKKITDAGNATIHHVKPHGALYNMAVKNKALAAVITQAVKDFDDKLILYGLSGSHLISEAQALNLQTASEVFADRTYQDDATLTPRLQPNALIKEENTSVHQVLQMIQHGTVTSVNNKTVPIVAETICIHGDNENAAMFAKQIYHNLKQNKIEIKAK
jgi:UPF0271 protein